MDQKLLDAFNNLSVALQQLSDSLSENNKNKESSTSSIIDSLKKLDIVEQVKSINEGVKKLESDNQIIVSEQKKIVDMVQKISQKQEDDSKIIRTSQESVKKKDNQTKDLGSVTDEKGKKTIMDGVKVIVLIAGGILALGLAFKVIGEVDWKSVLALSLAMPLLAVAFERISKVNVSLKDMAIANLGFIMMAGAIVASSFILKKVQTVSMSQVATIILISGAFSLLSFNIAKMAESMEGIKVKELWKMPIVLVAASVAISLSSQILQYVKPVGLLQLLTSILIAGVFTVLSFGLARISKAIKNVDPLSVALMPVVLVAASYAIMYSSQVLSKVVPISLLQAVTSILISATFVVLSYALPRIADAVKKIGIVEATLMPIVMVAMSVAITASSHILSGVQPIPFITLVNIALQAVALSVVSISMGLAMYFISDKLKLDPAKALMAGLSMVVIATTIMVTSLIMSMGSYEYYPSLSWSVGVSVSMLSFGIGMTLIGISGIGLPALLIGSVGVLIIAATILATDAILSNGNYEKYPSFLWSVGVGLSLTSFGLVMMATGAALPLIFLGTISIGLIASSVVKVSEILSSGKYENGPSLGWALGVGSLLTTFGTGLLLMGYLIGGTLGAGYLILKAGAAGVNVIAESIVDASFILAKGNYKGGPTYEWSRGTSLAISAFAPVYKSLSSGGILKAIFGGGGVTPEKMKNAIITISEGIVIAADFFAGKKVSFDNGIPYEWARGVSKALEGFAPVFKSLHSDGIFSIFTGGGPSVSDMKDAIVAISNGIIEAANIFNQNQVSFGGYPSYEWSNGVAKSISAFGPAIEWANNNSGWFKSGTKFLKNSIIGVADSIVEVSKKLQEGIFTNTISKEWIESISQSYRSFLNLIKMIDEVGTKSLNKGYDKIMSLASTIKEISIAVSSGNYTTMIPIDWMKNLTANLMEYQRMISLLSGTSSYNDTLFGIISVKKTYDLAKMSRDYDKLANSIRNLSSSIQEINIEKINALKTLTGSVVLLSLMDSDQFESMMDALEDKAGTLVDVINKIEDGVSGKEIRISTGSNEKGATMDDLVKVMNRMDARLGQIASTNNNISNYVNQLKANTKSNASIKSK